jgi:putative SOS response-associated peptidase YedK
MVAILDEGPDLINVLTETVMTRKFLTSLWPCGRALAPANGWAGRMPNRDFGPFYKQLF